MEGTSVLVTGASRGIGAAVARAFASRGADVILVARSVDRLERLATEFGARAVRCDLRDGDAIVAAAAQVRERLGGAPDILVNGAGVFHIATVQDTSPETLEANLAANLKGPFLLVREFLPEMLARGDGLIINVGSVAGRRAFPGNAAYSASKYGLRGFHEVLREETRGTGVRVSLIEPGAVDTEIWDPMDPDGHPELPSRADMLKPADVAEVAVFVAERSSTLTIPLVQVERA